MTDYKVGSLLNFISGNSDGDVGAKIVYEKVVPKPRAGAGKASSNVQSSPKFTVKSTLRKTGEKLKTKLSSSLLRSKRPEIAGDENSGAVGKSWSYLPSREDASEVDGKQAQPGSTFSSNAARRVHKKSNTKKHVDDPEREGRTIFVGNIPYAHTKKKKLIKFFSKYGEVESVRFRCAPLKDPRMSKRVAVIKHEFHPERSSICAFVVFKSQDEAKSALEANGAMYHEHHLRVDMAGSTSKKEVDPKKSVFIGNVSFVAEEEDLWELFSNCGNISSVRIIRDPITAVSKGVAFVNFETSDAVELALQLDGTTLKKRNISVRRHKPSSKSSSEKSPSGKVVRHKGAEPVKGNRKETEDMREKIRMEKKEKRKMRREGEKMLGIGKLKKSNGESVDNVHSELSESKEKEKKRKRKEEEVQNITRFKPSTSKFQGQTIDSSKKKKKKINKGELKKKKVAHLLGAGLQKKKKKV